MRQLKDYKMFLENVEFDINYVMGKPSCEIIYVEKDIIEKLNDADLVDYCHTYRGKIISCYCFADNEREDILKFIKSKSKINENPYSSNDNLQKELLTICVEFQKEMSTVIGKKSQIAFLKNPALSIIVSIIPDLHTNPFYEKRKDEINEVLTKMKKKYINATFYCLDQWNDPNISRYY
jgi:hypothetical protein